MDKSLEPRLIDFPRIYDPRGNLTFMENGQDCVPFPIERVFWIYDVPAGESRGGHAHYKCEQLLVAVNGSFDVNVFDGSVWKKFSLNRPYVGLYIPAGCWRTMDNFSSGSVCMSFASDKFDEADYMRDFDEYLRFVSKK